MHRAFCSDIGGGQRRCKFLRRPSPSRIKSCVNFRCRLLLAPRKNLSLIGDETAVIPFTGAVRNSNRWRSYPSLKTHPVFPPVRPQYGVIGFPKAALGRLANRVDSIRRQYREQIKTERDSVADLINTAFNGPVKSRDGRIDSSHSAT